MIQILLKQISACYKAIFLPRPQPLCCILPTPTGVEYLTFYPETNHIQYTRDARQLKNLFTKSTDSIEYPTTYAKYWQTLLIPEFLTLTLTTNTVSKKDTLKPDSITHSLHNFLPITDPLFDYTLHTEKDTQYARCLVADKNALKSLITEQTVAIFTLEQVRGAFIKQYVLLEAEQGVVFIDEWHDHYQLSVYTAEHLQKIRIDAIGLLVQQLDAVCAQMGVTSCLVCEQLAIKQLIKKPHNACSQITDGHLRYITKLPITIDIATQHPTLVGALLTSYWQPNKWQRVYVLYNGTIHHPEPYTKNL